MAGRVTWDWEARERLDWNARPLQDFLAACATAWKEDAVTTVLTQVGLDPDAIDQSGALYDRWRRNIDAAFARPGALRALADRVAAETGATPLATGVPVVGREDLIRPSDGFPKWLIPVGVAVLLAVIFLASRVNSREPQTNETNLTQTTPAAVQADIVIAHFDRVSHVDVAVEEQIRTRLQARLPTTGLTYTVATSDRPVKDEQGAEALRTESKARLVLWGLTDDLGALVHVELGEGQRVIEQRVQQLPGLVGAELPPLEVRIGRDGSDAAAFVAVLALGYLAYNEGNYSLGHRLLDEAMASMPPGVEFAKPATRLFLLARVAHQRGAQSNDLAGLAEAACGYAAAVKADSTAVEPLVNLGVVLATWFPRDEDADTTNEEPARSAGRERAEKCASEAAGVSSPREIFSAALELEPGAAHVEYNLLATMWAGSFSGEFESAQGPERLRTLYTKDPSIVGVSLMLGQLAIRDGNLEDAGKWFDRAADLLPGSSAARIDGALVALARGQWDDAGRRIDQVLPTAPDEAALLGARVLLRARTGTPAQLEEAVARAKGVAGRGDEEIFLLARVEGLLRAGSGDPRALVDARLAELEKDPCSATVDYEQDPDCASRAPPSRSARAKLCIDDGERLVRIARAALVGSTSGDLYLTREDPCPVFVPERGEEPPDWRTGPLGAAADYSVRLIAETCGGIQGSQFNAQLTNGCLSGPDPAERVHRLLDLVRVGWLANTLGQRVLFADLACPYVYTRSGPGETWIREGAILRGLRSPSLAATQSLPLAQFDGRLLIREEEPEVSYLDSVAITWDAPEGRRRTASSDPRLARVDGTHVVLSRGQAIELSFPVSPDMRNVRLEAYGHYVPLAAPPAEVATSLR